MSKLLKLSFLVAIIALLLTSCNEDNPLQDNGVTPTTPVANLQQVTSLVTSDSAGCYEIVFPMNFILDDGTTASVANEEELEALFQAPPFPINIGFPVNLTNPVTGDEVTAANEEELDGYLAECNYGPIGGGPCDSTNFELGFIGCYEIQFPVSFVLEDGTTATANNNDELANIFQPLNPIVDYAYPLNLVNIDTQEPATAANEEELSELLMSCDSNIGGGEGIMFEFLGCYNIQFPATFILEDGTTVTAASHEELESLFDPSNPPVEYAYPLTLTNAITGEVVTANSHEELEALLMDCGPTIDFPIGSIGCYEFVFPATFIFADSSTVTVQSADELAGIFNPMNPPVDFGYPLNLHNSDTGENVTANNSQ
ncbi:MAG TPA: hypothetical protein ENJ53_03535, partial [Phaeodactylibacter sp.]|nr:hypothetical protein [Phaeodactylibacter sp.]